MLSIWKQTQILNIAKSKEKEGFQSQSGIPTPEPQPATFDWVRFINGSYGGATATSSYVDSSGNVYLCGKATAGNSQKTISIATNNSQTMVQSISKQSNYDGAYIVKYNRAGEYQWLRWVDGAMDTDNGLSISVDAVGSVFFAGIVNYQYGGGTIKITKDASGNTQSMTLNARSGSGFAFFVVKYDSGGTYQWSRFMVSETYTNEFPFSLITNSVGDVFCVGVANGASLNYTTDEFLTDGKLTQQTSQKVGTYYGAFIIKYNSTGTFQWLSWMDSSTTDDGIYPNSIAIDNSGNLLITANLWGKLSVTFKNPSGNTTVITAPANTKGILFACNSDGIYKWIRYFRYVEFLQANIAVDSDNAIYVTGRSDNSGLTISRDSSSMQTPPSKPGSLDGAFLAKYNSDGVYQWFRWIDGSSYDQIRSIRIDENKNIFMVLVSSSATIYLNNTSANSSINMNFSSSDGSYTSGILKYTSEGNYKSLVNINQGTDITNLSIDTDGVIYIVGFSKSSPIATITNPGGSTHNSAYLIKYSEKPDYFPIVKDFYNKMYIPAKSYISAFSLETNTNTILSYIDVSGNSTTAWRDFSNKKSVLNTVESAYIDVMNKVILAYTSAYTASYQLTGFPGLSGEALTATTSTPSIATYLDALSLKNKYYGHIWIASGKGTNTMGYSLDGKTWISLSSLFTNIKDIVWNGSLFVAVGSGSKDSIAWSEDGITWTGLGKTIFTGYGTAVASNGSIWVAGGYSDTHTLAWSTDGKQWTGVGKSIFNWVNRFKWNGSMWVAVGEGPNPIAWSANGKDWIGVGKDILSQAKDLDWNGSMWIVAGWISGSQKRIAKSTDGKQWSGQDIDFINDATLIKWLSSSWALGGSDTTNNFKTSTNGVDWTTVSVGSPVVYINWIGNKWMATQRDGSVQTSTDGLTWTYIRNIPLLSRFDWNGSIIIATAVGDNTLAWSKDGVTWTGLGKTFFTTSSDKIIWRSSYIHSLITSLKTAVTSIQTTYAATKQSLTSKSITIPTDLDLDDTSLTNYIDADSGLFLVKQYTFNVNLLPRFSASSVILSNQEDVLKNGTFAVSASSSYSGTYGNKYPYQAVDGSDFSSWLSNASSASVESPDWIQISLPTAKYIRGYSVRGYSYGSGVQTISDFKLQGSLTGTEWTDIESVSSNSILEYTKTFSRKGPYSYYRLFITATNPSTSASTVTEWKLFDDCIYSPTKQDQLIAIYNLYKNANEKLEAILQSEQFKTTYSSARRFLTDAELEPSTISLRQSIYTNAGNYTTADILAGRRDILNKIVNKYGNVKNTSVAADQITESTSAATLESIQTKYLTATSGALWPVYLEELRLFVNNYISTTYKSARNAAAAARTISYEPTVYLSDSDISRDISYIDSSGISQSIDLSGGGIVRYMIASTDATGISHMSGYELYGSGANANLYTAPSSFTTISSASYNIIKSSFTSNGLTFIVSTSSTSAWLNSDGITSTFNSTGSTPGGDVIIQFPKYATVSGISFISTCRTNTTCTFTLYGKNKESDSWTQIASNPSGQRYILLSEPYPTYVYYRLDMSSGNVTNIKNIMYSGVFKTPTFSSEYGLIMQLYQKYKTALDNIAAVVRRPALANLSTYRDMYASLSQCIPSDFSTNPAYAPMYAAVSSSALAPSLAPSSSTDEMEIQALSSASDVAPYTSKYAQQIVNLFTILRQNQIDTLTAYGKLYNRYVQFQGNSMIQQYAVLPTLPSTSPSIPNNGSTDLETMQTLAIPTTSSLPSSTDINALAGNCSTYNGDTGLFNTLRTFLKSQLETFIGEYDTLYNSLSDAMKITYPYTSPLTSGILPSTVTVQELYEYMNSYGGFAQDSLYSTTTLSPTVSYTGNTASAAVDYMKAYYVDTYLPVRKYLRSTEFTSDMQAAVTLCEKYITSTGSLKSNPLTLQTGDTLSSIIRTTGDQTTAMIKALINEYNTSYNTWVARIPSLSTTDPVPTSFDTDIQTPTLALRGVYLGKWDSFMLRIKEGTKNKLKDVKSLQTWKTTGVSTSVTVGGSSTTGIGNA